MSLTGADTLMAAVHESGVNDFMTAFFNARPRYLNYGTPAFVPVTTFAATSIPAINFPGVPGGIDLLIVFAQPTVDFDPDSSGGASPLPPGPGQLAIHTTVRLTIVCKNLRQEQFIPISTSLELFATGVPLVHVFAPGRGEITFHLDRLEIVDITPDSLESVLECLLLMMLRSALQNFRLPFDAIDIEFVTLNLNRGPLIENDQLKVFGGVL